MVTGLTLSQPLVLHDEEGFVGPDGTLHKEIVVHLGQSHLKLLTLDGHEIASHWVQSGDLNSLARISYAERPGLGGLASKVVYVATRPPTVKAYSLQELLAVKHGAAPLGAYSVGNGQYIVAAPVYLGETPIGEDVVAIPVVDNRFYLLVGIAEQRETGDPWFIDMTDVTVTSGWNSATPLKTEAVHFATTLGKQFNIYTIEDGLTPTVASSIENLTFGQEALSQVVREGPTSPLFFTVEKNGVFHKLDIGQQTGWTAKPSTFQGFTNVGPSTDGEFVYFGFRWEGSTTSTNTGGKNGVLVAVHKGSWEPAWETRIPIMNQTHDRSWINITPIVWEPAQDPADRRIIVGDAGGALTALTPQGGLSKLFLTNGNNLPVGCSEIESTGPEYRPSFRYSEQAMLTLTPNRQSDPANAWFNTQGVTTEMSIYGGRLYTGYAHATPAQSALVILRAASNISVGELRIEQQDASGGYIPLGAEDLLKAGTKVRVTAPVTYQGDPVKGPLPVAIWAGFHDGAKSERVESLDPFVTKQVVFELVVPKGKDDAVLSVTVNPALFNIRRDSESQRELPPGVTEAPPALPAAWGSGGAIPIGEVWSLDNSRSAVLARTVRNDCMLSSFNTDKVVTTDTIGFSVSLRFLSHINQETQAELEVTAKSAAGLSASIPSSFKLRHGTSGEVQEGEFWNVPVGTYHLMAVLSCPDDSNPDNNRREATVIVQDPETRQGGGGSAQKPDH